MCLYNKFYYIYYYNSFDLLNKFQINQISNLPYLKYLVCNLNIIKLKNYLLLLSSESYNNLLLKIWIIFTLLGLKKPQITNFYFIDYTVPFSKNYRKNKGLSLKNFYNIILFINKKSYITYFIMSKIISNPINILNNQIKKNRIGNSNLSFIVHINDFFLENYILNLIFSKEELINLELQINFKFNKAFNYYFFNLQYKNLFPFWLSKSKKII